MRGLRIHETQPLPRAGKRPRAPQSKPSSGGTWAELILAALRERPMTLAEVLTCTPDVTAMTNAFSGLRSRGAIKRVGLRRRNTSKGGPRVAAIWGVA